MTREKGGRLCRARHADKKFQKLKPEGDAMGTLEGRVAIITGAATGIGFAAADRLAREGAVAVIVDIKGHEEAAEKLHRRALKAEAVAANVTDVAAITELVNDVMKKHKRIDIVVNNAALTGVSRMPFEQISHEDWRHMLEVNVVGVVNMCRAVSPHMRAAKSGRIVNVVSGTAFKGAAGVLHYVASKGAIISMTRSLANEFSADNVIVNAVSPGFTVTERMAGAPEWMAPLAEAAVQTRFLKRQAVPEDVANVIHFLSSDDSGFVTGQIVAADGGSVLH